MRSRHMHVSMKDLLQHNDKTLKSLAPFITCDGVAKFHTAEDVRQFAREMLAQGVELIPCGDCDNFDPVTGCKGHDDPKPPDNFVGESPVGGIAP